MIQSEALTAQEWQSLKEDPGFIENHNEALLQYFSRSVRFTIIPVHMVAIAISAALYTDFQSIWVVFWWLALVAVQSVRFYLAKQVSKTQIDIKKRQFQARAIALITSLSLGSSALFAAEMQVETRALLSMLMVGVIAASTATSLGYKPFYLNSTIPLFIAIIGLWSLDPQDKVENWVQILVVLLTCQLAAVMFGLIRQVYGFFVRTLHTQVQLQTALDAETQANAAKTRFLAAASHDLRQPLHTMSLFSAALAIRPLDTKSKAIAVKMNDAMQLLSDELDSLLDISKLDANVVSVNAKIVNLSDLVSQIISSIKPTVDEKNLQLVTKIQPQIFTHTDAELFSRMLRNIIENAVKYTNKGNITCTLSVENSIASLKITDTGTGISAEEQSHIWEEFYQINNQARERQHGLGLGLSVVKRLSLLLGTEVRLIHSGPEGSCFEIVIQTVPVEEDCGLSNTHHTTIQETDFLAGRQVLIVDDDEGIQLSTRSLLTDLGMQTFTASRTAEAIAQFKTQEIDCVLMDLRLADGDDGFEAIRELRAIQPSVPIIIISGDTAPDRISEANSIDCAWLVKPVTIEQLVSEFRKILA